MLAQADIDGGIDGARQHAVEGPPRRELARLDADHLPEQGDAGAQVRFGEAHLRLRRRQARLGLGHVRAGHLADIEAVARLAQLLVDDLDVVALKVEDGRVAQHVHVGLGAVEQHRLLGVAQGLAGAEHLRLGLTGRVQRPVAVEQRLVDLDAGAARIGGRGTRAEIVAGLGVGGADIGRRADDRASQRARPRHVLVRGAHARPLRPEGRVAAIGARQRALERLGRSPLRQPLDQAETQQERAEGCPASQLCTQTCHLLIRTVEGSRP